MFKSIFKTLVAVVVNQLFLRIVSMKSRNSDHMKYIQTPMKVRKCASSAITGLTSSR